MKRINNYAIQAQQAKQLFATSDQEALNAKLKLPFDEEYLYATMFSER